MKASVILRWTGRCWSLASLAFVLAFALDSRGLPSASETVGLAFFPVGVAGGLLVAWVREGIGGSVTLLSLACFYGWSMIVKGQPPSGPWFVLVAAPGFLFTLASILESARPKEAA
jgi:hypothetical protein